MKKTLLLLLAATSLVACSNTDNTANEADEAEVTEAVVADQADKQSGEDLLASYQADIEAKLAEIKETVEKGLENDEFAVTDMANVIQKQSEELTAIQLQFVEDVTALVEEGGLEEEELAEVIEESSSILVDATEKLSQDLTALFMP